MMYEHQPTSKMDNKIVSCYDIASTGFESSSSSIQRPNSRDRDCRYHLQDKLSPISVLDTVEYDSIDHQRNDSLRLLLLKQPPLPQRQRDLFLFTTTPPSNDEMSVSCGRSQHGEDNDDDDDLDSWELVGLALAPPQLLRMTSQETEEARLSSRPSDPIARYLMSQEC